MERRTVTHVLAAKKLGCATRTIERMLRDGRLKAIPYRDRLLVDADDLELVLRDRRLLRKRRQPRAAAPLGIETKTRESAPRGTARARASLQEASVSPSRFGIPKLSTRSAASGEQPAGITPLGAELVVVPLKPFGQIRRPPTRLAAVVTVALASLIAIVVAMRVTDHPVKLETGRGAPSAAHVRTPALTKGIPISRGGPASAAVARGGAAESLPIEASPPSQAAPSPAAIKPSHPGQSSAPRTSTSCFGGLTFGC